MENYMKERLLTVCVIVMVLFLASCSSKTERMIKGKWTLKRTMIGNSPSSFWFKGGGSVEAPWENRSYAVKSNGTYEFVDDTHIRIEMNQGYYAGNIYYFEILMASEDELTLRDDYQDIKLKRVE
jgi:hypothetical protein